MLPKVEWIMNVSSKSYFYVKYLINCFTQGNSQRAANDYVAENKHHANPFKTFKQRKTSICNDSSKLSTNPWSLFLRSN